MKLDKLRWLALVACLVLAACGGGDSEDQRGVQTTVASITVTPPSASIAPGQQVAFSAVAKDAAGQALSGIAFTWTSSDLAVATIDAAGVVIGVQGGTVRVTASAQGVTSEASAVTVAAPPQQSSAGLIDAAEASGTIDAETALTYKVYALFGDARLPEAYRGDDREQVESSVLEEVMSRWDTLSPEVAQKLGPFLLRPADLGSWASPATASAQATGGRRETALAGAAPPRPTCSGPAPNWASVIASVAPKAHVWYDTRVTGDLAIAQRLSAAIESTFWPRLFAGGLGLKEPLDDSAVGGGPGCFGGNARLDVYIVHQGTRFRGLTVPDWTSFLQGWTGRQAPAYVLINADYSEVEPATAHELMHASQWAYRMAQAHEDYGWLLEALANWAVDFIYGKTNQYEQKYADCYTSTPHLKLDDESTGHCKQGSTIERKYGAYLLMQYIAKTSGDVAVKQILEATENIPDKLQVVNDSLSGGFEKLWPEFAKTLWNQGPIPSRADSFTQWDSLTQVPKLAPDHTSKIVADLGGQPEAETEFEGKVANLGINYYHVTFSDANTRSLMFHNTFYDNYLRGQDVSVQVLMRREGETTWFEEDWTKFEWIGLCRDFKIERLAEMVIIIASAEFRGTSPVVIAPKPTLKRNNIGCYGYKGQTKRTFRHKTWSSGQQVVIFDATFDYLPSGQPMQYTNEAEGRLRVPVAAPMFTGGVAAFDEGFVSNGCTYTANASLADKSILLGGKSIVNLLINNFAEAMPLHLRAGQYAAIGSAERSYFAEGASGQSVKGTITGPQPDCGTEYETGIGGWLLTDKETQSPKVAPDGHLRGTYTTPDDTVVEVYTWDLEPIREP